MNPTDTVTLLTYEQFLGALCVWREARSEGQQGMLGVWWTVNNRATDSQRRWPRTVAGVVLQRSQFDAMTIKGDPETITWPIPPIPTAAPSADWAAFLGAQEIVTAPLGADPTNGANYYESEPTPPDPVKMPWFDPANLTVKLGAIRFYRELYT
jgi:hypothetical protein